MLQTTILQLLCRTCLKPREMGLSKLIRVFVASPGDLGEERIAFRRVIDEVNKIKANSLGYSIEPLGWEDTLPGRGRPQALINEDVHRCHLFVLLLWKRWGTFSGQYSSGTEEEFEIARARNEKTSGAPDIWLYFKSVPSSCWRTPASNFKKCLSFEPESRPNDHFSIAPLMGYNNGNRCSESTCADGSTNKKPFEPAPTTVTFASMSSAIDELVGASPAATAATAKTAFANSRIEALPQGH